MTKAKIKNITQLKKITDRLKSKAKKIVFTTGCFDLLHYGHVKYLAEAKIKGDILIVAVNSNSSIKRLKGRLRPIIGEKDRLRIIAALESVDYVIAFKEDTPLKLIQTLKPDILVKGADWPKKDIVGREVVLSYSGRVKTIKLAGGRSTSALIKKIAQRFYNY